MNIPEIASTAVVLIDMQERLVPAMSAAAECVNRQKVLLEAAKVLKLDVLVSEQYPAGLGNTVGEIKAVLPENTPAIAKTSFSCFGESAFVAALEAKKRKSLIIAGIESHVCVYQTVMDALSRKYEVFVLADAVTSRLEESKKLALSAMRHAGANVINVEAALFLLLRDARHPDFKAISKLVR